MSVIITRNIPKVRANFQRGQSVTTGWLMQERLDRARPLGQVCQLGFLPPVIHKDIVPVLHQTERSLILIASWESFCWKWHLSLYEAAVKKRIWDNPDLSDQSHQLGLARPGRAKPAWPTPVACRAPALLIHVIHWDSAALYTQYKQGVAAAKLFLASRALPEDNLWNNSWYFYWRKIILNKTNLIF